MCRGVIGKQRWTWVVSILGAGAMVLWMHVGAVTAQLEKELVIVTTGGVLEQKLREHFYDPFTRQTGVVVKPVAANDSEQWAKVKAMSMTGRGDWDIVSVSLTTIISGQEYLAEIDCNELPNVLSQGVPGTCRSNTVVRTIGGSVLAYNSEVFPPGRRPRNWADFWNVQAFPGPRALPNAGFPWAWLTAALLADGVPRDKLFPMDVDRAFRKMDQIKPYIRVWWKTGDQSQQIMRDREVVMAMMWSGRALTLKDAGVPVEVEWNEGIKEVAFWGILKNAPHPRAAKEFLNFFLDRPEAHAAFSRAMYYDTANKKVLDSLSEEERKKRVTYEENLRSMVEMDFRWIAANRDRLLERWNAWLAN